eukprot:5125619-Amphidinium_carterae.1
MAATKHAHTFWVNGCFTNTFSILGKKGSLRTFVHTQKPGWSLIHCLFFDHFMHFDHFVIRVLTQKQMKKGQNKALKIW